MPRDLNRLRDRINWLDELAMAIVEGRSDDALGLLHDAYPVDMPSAHVARLLHTARRLRAAEARYTQ